MKSLRELLLYGPGPSSSHTIGPYRIALDFASLLQGRNVTSLKITLFGSLALTGKGHRTDYILKETLKQYPVEVLFDTEKKDLPHPNTMTLIATFEDGTTLSKTYLSLGGGSYCEEGKQTTGKDIYPFTTFDGMKEYMKEKGITDVYSLIEQIEGKDIFTFGEEMLGHTFSTLEASLNKTGYLPGPLHLTCVSKEIYQKALKSQDEAEKRTLLLSSYAYATAEANARGEMIVTTPTCGSAGVVPAVLYYGKKVYHDKDTDLVKAFLVGALVCNFIKENASLSGALLGCQAEIGSASSFASASLAYLRGLSLHQIEYASEVSMEHFLGLTCDPVDGYVQIPCIERNAIAALHAYASYLFAKDISPYRQNRVSFDNVIRAMKETGSELPSDLKETSLGGLAKIIR